RNCQCASALQTAYMPSMAYTDNCSATARQLLLRCSTSCIHAVVLRCSTSCVRAVVLRCRHTGHPWHTPTTAPALSAYRPSMAITIRPPCGGRIATRSTDATQCSKTDFLQRLFLGCDRRAQVFLDARLLA